MSKKVKQSIYKPISRLSCGEGLAFVDDVPYFSDVFPLVNNDAPDIVKGMVYIDLDYDANGYPEWNLTYMPTSLMHGMVKETEYELPKIKIPEAANSQPESINKKPTDVQNIFQRHVMGDRTLFGYPLIGNKLDYLRDPKELIETHFNELVDGIGVQLNTHIKNATDYTAEQIENVLSLNDMLMSAELPEFTFSIYMPPQVFKDMHNGYCVMPRITGFNPFNNFATDKYQEEVPEKIGANFAKGLKKAKDEHGLKFQIEVETLSDELKKLKAKFDKGEKYTPSNLCRHTKNRKHVI